MEEENKAYQTWTLRKWQCKWEQEIRRKLMSERAKERRTHVVEFVHDEWRMASLKERSEAVQALWRKTHSTNELRQKAFGDNPVSIGDDLHMESFAMSPSQAGATEDQSKRKNVQLPAESGNRMNGHARSVEVPYRG